MKRTLVLHRESLSQLTTDELAGVAGGAEAITGQARTCPVKGCLEDLLSLNCYPTYTCCTASASC